MSIPKYIIAEVNDNMYINTTKIPSEIFDEEKTQYRIEHRETLIDNLCMWITECRSSDKQLMKDDLKMLMNVKDEYILSSISTNHYLYGNSEEFKTQCEEILSHVK